MEKQGVGWLFGRVEQSQVLVDAIYEPPQQNELAWVALLEDRHFNIVTEMARHLDTTLVGWVFSHRARSPPLNPDECLFAADKQRTLKFFTTVCSVLHEDGTVSFEAYQVSDVLCTLVDKKLVEVKDEKGSLKTKKPVIVDKREVTEFDVHRIILPVPITQHSDRFIISFPIENRFSTGPVNLSAFAAFWHGAAAERRRMSSIILDFHFLLFLVVNVFPLDSDGAALLQCVQNHASLTDDDWETWKMILDGYAGNS